MECSVHLSLRCFYSVYRFTKIVYRPHQETTTITTKRPGIWTPPIDIREGLGTRMTICYPDNRTARPAPVPPLLPARDARICAMRIGAAPHRTPITVPGRGWRF